MEFRIANENDRKSIMKLWEYCFEGEEDPFYNWYFSNFFKLENTIVAQKGEDIEANLQLNPYKIFLRGNILDTSYVVGLATEPEKRGQGVVKNLLLASLIEMRKRGHYVSLLMPFKAQFYYPYDFEFCYHHLKYTIPIEDLKYLKKGYGEFKKVTSSSDYEKLSFIYDKFVKNKHGYVVRNEENWKHLIEEHLIEKGYIAVLEKESKPLGYLFYYLKDNKMIVKEMVFTEINAQKSIFKFIYNHSSQVETLEWNASLDDLTYLNLPDPKKGIEVFPFMTGRIVDVKEVLEKISYPKNIAAKINFTVKDDLADWNNYSYSLEVKDGKGKVVVIEEKTSLEMSIGALSQLYFGRLSIAELVYSGKIKIQNEEEQILLDSLFPKCTNFINEYI